MTNWQVKMNFTENSSKLPVINFDFIEGGEKKAKHHGNLLPDSIRAVLCGPSNIGKTSLLLSLLIHPNGVRFENIYLFSKSLNQPKYKFLKELLEPIEGIEFFPYNEHADVPSPSEARMNSLMIFDDIACEKQDNVRAFFCMGRHKNVDCFYLCQSYAQVPKHLVRDNANLLVLFRQDEKNLKHIYDDHVNTDMSFLLFKELCSTCWRNNHDFLVIDKDSPINEGRYRRGFDNFLTINTAS